MIVFNRFLTRERFYILICLILVTVLFLLIINMLLKAHFTSHGSLNVFYSLLPKLKASNLRTVS